MGALGLNLLIALALLAPGFAAYMAVFSGGRTRVRAAPPAPNSIAALGVVVFAHVGYEGLLVDLTLTPDKTISSLLMSDVKLFHIVYTGARMLRVENERDDPIPQLHLAGERVRNIAFEPITIPNAR